MPPHPDRVRRNYEDGWWKDQPPIAKPEYTGPALWLTAFYLLVLALVAWVVLR